MEQPKPCAIWGTEATYESNTNYIDALEYNSPRAGGRYCVCSLVCSWLQEIDNYTKARLTDWLIKQRRLGIKIPFITGEQIERAKIARLPSIIERANRVLDHLAIISDLPGKKIDLANDDLHKAFHYIHAVAGSSFPNFLQVIDSSEVDFFLDFLRKKGFINYQDSTSPYLFHSDIIVSVEGYAHLEALNKSHTESSLAFVAMWFDPSMNSVWKKGIEPAIRATGFEAVRIDNQEFNNKIDDEIIAQIRRSRFLVADFSQGDAGPRGGVYYEAGFAHGLNIPVIFTCRKKDIKIVHFDTRQFNHIVWDTPEDLEERLRQRIAATIGDGPLYKTEH